MQNEQLAYVREQLNKGVDRTALREDLAKHGYDENLINSLFDSVDRGDTPVPSPTASNNGEAAVSGMFSIRSVIGHGFRTAFDRWDLIGWSLLFQIVTMLLIFFVSFAGIMTLSLSTGPAPAIVSVILMVG